MMTRPTGLLCNSWLRAGAITAGMLIWSGTLLAQPAEPAFILSYGNDSCGQYIQANSQSRQMYLSWVVGFITGQNTMSRGNARLVGKQWDSAAFTVWLQNYCTAHPLELFIGAAQRLREDQAKEEGINSAIESQK